MTYDREATDRMVHEGPHPTTVPWALFHAVYMDLVETQAHHAFERATSVGLRFDLHRARLRIDALRREAATAWAILGLLSVFRRKGRLTAGPQPNRVECVSCGHIIESTSRHHYVTCTCGKVSLDGGNAYWRVVYRGPWRRVNSDGTFGEIREAQKATEVL